MHFAALAAAALLVAGAANAQTPDTPNDYLRDMDANHDGRVQLAEYQDYLSYAFNQIDRNRDGVLQPHEYPPGVTPRPGPLRTLDQHHAALAKQFRLQDSNHDGTLGQPPR
jgi:Ca2+-binding EF-hand superfamily protein